MNLHKLVVARSDITAALESCKLLMKSVDKLGHELYYPLYCSIVICYARPFTGNKTTGPLSKHWRGFSDPRLQGVHDALIRARNEVIAHDDRNIRQVKVFPSGTQIEKTGLISGKIGIGVESYYFPLEWFQAIHDTCYDLGKRLNDTIEKEIERIYGGIELPNAPFKITFDEGL